MALDINALYGSLTDNELAGLSMAREINAAFPITRDGTVYNFLPTGEIETTTPNDLEGRQTGATLGLFSPTGETIVEPYYNESFGETSGSQMLGRALIGASLGAMLGPVGFGLAAPAAAAAGSGLTAYSSTGNVEDALKAAALGGAAAYGFQEFVNPLLQQSAYDTAFAAADAANMANAGLDANTIATNLRAYVDPSTATSLANSAATQAGSLSYANQLVAQGFTPTEIAAALTDLGVSNTVAQSAASAASEGITQIAAQDLVSNITYQPQVRNPIQASPGAIEVTGTAVQPGLLTAPVAAATTGLLGAQAAPIQSVAVQTTTAPTESQTATPVAAVGGALAPVQTVPVQAATTPAQTQATAPVAAAAGGLLTPVQTVPVQAATTPVQTAAPEVGAATGGLLAQTVPVQAATAPVQTQATAPVAAATGGLLAPESQVVPVQAQTVQTQETAPAAAGAASATQTVPVDDRLIRREEAQILTPVVTGAIGSVPIADVNVPRSSTGPVEGTRTIDPLVALGLLGLAGAALSGGGSTGAPVDQAAYDAIARGRSPVYPRGEFTPISIGGLPGGGLDVGIDGSYDYFGPYYGAGRFGARPRAFAFPGLLSPTMVNMATPTAPATTPATTPVAPGFFRPTMPPSAKPAAMVTTPNSNEVFSFVPVPINYGDTGFTLIP